MTIPRTAREVHLAAHPRGWPIPEDFALVEAPVPEPADGQVLVRNHWMSVDPYMRGRMNAGPSYAPPFEVGRAMNGGAVGEVVASRSPALAEGDLVVGMGGWREYAVGKAEHYQRIDAEIAPEQAYLGVLGMPGMTAYVGLLDLGRPAQGETVFVSGAAGAVGSIVGQIAKIKGARVVGSAGSAAKVAHVTGELGFDGCLNYHDGPVAEQLAALAPDGIDVYFDNVGGEHLEAAIGALRQFGRVVACGAISQYNDEAPAPGPRNLSLIVGKRLTLRGFIVSDHADRQEDFRREVAGWLREGRIRTEETVVEGIENAAAAFLGMLHGENTGKMLVKL